MPTNKKIKGGKKKKVIKQETHDHKSLKNHKENTPEMKKVKLAQMNMYVQRMLGRPIKKYNLLYDTNEGAWFYSEDDIAEGGILEILRKKGIEHPNGCKNWNLMYMIKSKDLDDDKQFFMYANLGDTITRKGISLNTYEYFTWKELKQ